MKRKEHDGPESAPEKRGADGSNARGARELQTLAPLHLWEALPGEKPHHVKVPTLSFSITPACLHVGQKLKDLQLPAEYGMHVVKLEQHCPYNLIDRPGSRHEIAVGDRLHALFEADEPRELQAREDRHLREHFLNFYNVSDLRSSKVAQLADENMWSTRFRRVVEDFDLQSPDVHCTCEQWDCFQVTYPSDAPPAWIGSPLSSWPAQPEADANSWRKKHLELAEEVAVNSAPELRALNMRFNFELSPVMVGRSAETGDRTYVCPSTATTIVKPGDWLVFLRDGRPGGHPSFRLDPRVWIHPLRKLTNTQVLAKLPRALDRLDLDRLDRLPASLGEESDSPE